MNKKRNYRKKICQSDSDDDDEENEAKLLAKLEERKEVQKFRERQKGVNAEDLAAVRVVEKKPKEKDPFKLNTGGGLVQMSDVSRLETVDDELNLGPAFSAETKKLDEDVQMLRYIDSELKKKRGENESEDTKKQLSKEDLLYQLPDEINVKSKIIKSEEMLSAAMLTGIPEVDLGVQAKIKNIEDTENARIQMIDESRRNEAKPSVFVPTNMATNFQHHSRFMDEKRQFQKERRDEEKKKKEEAETEVKDVGPTVGSDIVDGGTSSTEFMQRAREGGDRKRDKKQEGSDDYYLERFKKKARESAQKGRVNVAE